MTNIKTINNTILVRLATTGNTVLQEEDSYKLKEELTNYFNKPNTNILLDFNGIEDINHMIIDVLISGQKLSKRNNGQLSLFNVKEKVFNAFTNAKAEHLFFFCDMPKHFSYSLTMV